MVVDGVFSPDQEEEELQKLSVFTPIKQVKPSVEVLEQIKQAIVMGTYKAGEKLPSERALIEEFQVSRSAVREAIRVLDMTGFLTVRLGATGGAYVNELNFNNMSNAFIDLFRAGILSVPDLANVRGDIEPKVAALAAQNAGSEEKKLLLETFEHEFLPFADIQDRVKRLTRVHYFLAEICGNKIYEAIVKSLLALNKEIVEVVGPDHQKLHNSGEHRHIVEAVVKGDPDEAYTAMEHHLSTFTHKLLKMEKSYRNRTKMR